ncbi:MAG: chemotaxis protein CheA [Bacteroidales bacterium]|nr:chemotaxis protein CheA [Bacteroidales bacterium]
MDKFKNKFIEEATDNIEELEDSLLLIENDTENKDLIEKIFRAMHSLKGGGAMFGFSYLSDFTHNLENLYQVIREGKRTINKEILDITLASVDHMKTLLTIDDLNNEDVIRQHKELIEKTQNITNNTESVEDNQSNEKIGSYNNVEEKSYYIHFEPQAEVFKDGTNPIFLIDELNSLGETMVLAHFNKLPEYDKLDIIQCYTYWEIIISTKEDFNSISDVFIFIEDQCKLEIVEIADFDIFSNDEIVEQISVLTQDSEDIGLPKIQEIVKKNSTVKILNKELERVIANPNLSTPIKENTISSIRVSANKLDHLMNLVSELVTTQARLNLIAEKSENSELITIAENIQKLSRQLRDNAFDIVLIPIETMLVRFQRLVRDLSKELNKEIIFLTEGADTELDKTIIESLTDPLLHILRNSIDHGIESPEQRLKLNKSPQGKILLKAFYSGANVHIQIHDDGAGIDINKIKRKAIEKGFIDENTILNKKEILDLVFLPGFSTAENITDLSGRGVGMDVVKRKITEIRGEIELDTEVNIGTTLTIKLPLTLSIIDGLLVKIHKTHYVLPLSVVDKIYVTDHSKVVNKYNNMIVLDGEQIPFYYLREEFDLPESTQEVEQVVVVKYEDKKIGLVVDEVEGEYQAVLKSLGKIYKKQEMISGATILGDGTVALVMDTNKIINRFSQTIVNVKQNNI